MAKKYLSKENREKIRDSIDDWYKTGRVRENIRNLNINHKKLKTALQRSDIEEYKNYIYDTYNIHKYANKKEFYEERTNFMTDKQIDVLWEDYKHRDKLITSGQYDEYRLKSLKENYITKLKKTGYPKEVISNIEKLSAEQWREIVNIPNANKKNLKEKVLPDIGSFYYEITGVYKPPANVFVSNVGDIRQVFERAGIDWEYEEETLEYQRSVLKKLKKRFVPQEQWNNVIDDDDVDTYIDSILSLASEEDIKQLGGSTSALKLIDRLGGNIKYYRPKSDVYYIPGVGSTNPKSKSRDVIANFIYRARIYFKNK